MNQKELTKTFFWWFQNDKSPLSPWFIYKYFSAGRVDAGPPSSKLFQHKTSIGSTSRVCEGRIFCHYIQLQKIYIYNIDYWSLESFIMRGTRLISCLRSWLFLCGVGSRCAIWFQYHSVIANVGSIYWSAIYLNAHTTRCKCRFMLRKESSINKYNLQNIYL